MLHLIGHRSLSSTNQNFRMKLTIFALNYILPPFHRLKTTFLLSNQMGDMFVEPFITNKQGSNLTIYLPTKLWRSWSGLKSLISAVKKNKKEDFAVVRNFLFH